MNAVVQHPSLLESADIEPSGVYEAIRAAGDVVWDEKLNAWLVSSYDLVRKVSQNDRGLWRSVLVWTESMPVMGLDENTWMEVQGGSPKHIFLIEGDPHERMHRWWLRTLQSRVLKHWEETLIRPVAHAQIDRVATAGKAELVTDYADRVAPRVICAIMGLPWQDEAFVQSMIELPDRVVELLQRQAESEHDPHVLADALAAKDELNELLLPFVRERRSGEGSDFISMLWRDAPQIFEEGYACTELDIAVQAATAFSAASETTASATASGLYLLMTRPGLVDQVRAGGTAAVRAFIEETLRLYGPVSHRPRIAMRDTELGDVHVKKGEMVIAILHAGSRDPEHYREPADVVLDRKVPQDHFAFYRGERMCPGHQLARVELEIIFEVALERLHNLRLDPAAPAPVYKSLLVRRWAPLHSLFDAQPATANA